MRSLSQWLFGPGSGYLLARWLWLRALGLIFLSAFYSLAFQIDGLVGPHGILPAGHYLQVVQAQLGLLRFWYAPTLLWLGSGTHMLAAICWVGAAASILLVLNFWPRASIVVCFICFLSFVVAAQDFSSYQSDGMLLSAGFLSFFFAPSGFRPDWGEGQPPSRASLFMLRWLWFSIYFESGLVKILSGDPQWRHLTALDQYYQNGPLPDWIGWYAQQLPHRFQAGVALVTLIMELGVCWLMFLPRRFRILCFCLVTPFQIAIILTANLTFLNYFVLALGILLLDDQVLGKVARRLGWRVRFAAEVAASGVVSAAPASSGVDASPPARAAVEGAGPDAAVVAAGPQEPAVTTEPAVGSERDGSHAPGWRGLRTRLAVVIPGVLLTWVFYNTVVLLLSMIAQRAPLPVAPIVALEPFRISNQYGLFAVMTGARYEIEFQGTRDGGTWIPYPFRYKPQNPYERPRIFAPYQPRFDWNLWFASLGAWREYPWVVQTEVLLLRNDRSVLSLFAGDPFASPPPREVRAVLWQYWFTDLATKRRTGLWWRREFRGLYGPVVALDANGQPVALAWPQSSSSPP